MVKLIFISKLYIMRKLFKKTNIMLLAREQFKTLKNKLNRFKNVIKNLR